MAHTTELTGPDLAVGIAMSELSENVPFLGHARGEAIVLVRTGAEVRAVGATCSHYGGPLAEGLVVGETLRCPWHHACFDLRTGDAFGAPALNPIACYEVERRGDRVIVGPKKSRSASATTAEFSCKCCHRRALAPPARPRPNGFGIWATGARSR